MSKKKRDEEREILNKMFENNDTTTDIGDSGDQADKSSNKNTSKKQAHDDIRCPKCGYLLSSRSSCPRCGYNGYVPMSKSESKRIKLILYPILGVLAVLLYLYVKGYFG